LSRRRWPPRSIARGAEGTQAKALLGPLVDGATPGCVAVGLDHTERPVGCRGADGILTVTGTVPAVLGAGLAGLAVLPVTAATPRGSPPTGGVVTSSMPHGGPAPGDGAGPLVP